MPPYTTSQLSEVEQGSHQSYQQIPSAAAAIDVGAEDEATPLIGYHPARKSSEAGIPGGSMRPLKARPPIVIGKQPLNRRQCSLHEALLLGLCMSLAIIIGTTSPSPIAQYDTWGALEGIPVPKDITMIENSFLHAASGHARKFSLNECILKCDQHSKDSKFGVHYNGGGYHDDLCLCFSNTAGLECLWDEAAILGLSDSSSSSNNNATFGSSSSFLRRLERGVVFSKYPKPSSCGLNHFCNSDEGAKLCMDYVGPNSISGHGSLHRHDDIRAESHP